MGAWTLLVGKLEGVIYKTSLEWDTIEGVSGKFLLDGRLAVDAVYFETINAASHSNFNDMGVFTEASDPLTGTG